MILQICTIRDRMEGYDYQESKNLGEKYHSNSQRSEQRTNGNQPSLGLQWLQALWLSRSFNGFALPSRSMIGFLLSFEFQFPSFFPLSVFSLKLLNTKCISDNSKSEIRLVQQNQV